jgi:hypothetical protein
MDILSHFDFEFTKTNTGRLQVEFLKNENARGAVDGVSPRCAHLPVEPFLGGVPSVKLRIVGVARTCLLDTGAHIQYVPSEVVRGRQPSGHRMDFLPDQGEFETPIFLLDVTVEGKSRQLEFGTLPPLFEMSMSMFGTDWAILGTDFLRTCMNERVRLDRDSLEIA